MKTKITSTIKNLIETESLIESSETKNYCLALSDQPANNPAGISFGASYKAQQRLQTDTLPLLHSEDQYAAQRFKSSHSDEAPPNAIDEGDFSKVEVVFRPSNFEGRIQNMPILGILDKIQSEEWHDQISQLRTANEASKRGKIKAKLPVFMISMSSNGGMKASNVSCHSGLLQLDFDNLGDEKTVSEFRNLIGRDPHVWKSWISPSGDGVKAIMRIPSDIENHKISFKEAENYVLLTYNKHIDKACSNLNRLCYVSSDPDLVTNEQAKVLPVMMGSSLAKSPTKVSRLSIPSVSKIEYDDSVLRSIKHLKEFYNTHVTPNFPKPDVGYRNLNLVDLAVKLFFRTTENAIRNIVIAYWNQYSDVFKDYECSKALGESASLMRNCESSFLAKLPLHLKEQYLELSSAEKRAAFRICESLSRCESDETVPPPTFHLSYHQLGIRLGLEDVQASRIMEEFEGRGLIKLLVKGQRYKPGEKSVGSIYEWLHYIEVWGWGGSSAWGAE